MKIYPALSSVRLGDTTRADEWIVGSANEIYAFSHGVLSLKYYHDEFADDVVLVEYEGRLLAAVATPKREAVPSRLELHALDGGTVPAGAQAVARYLYYHAQCERRYLGHIFEEQDKDFLARFDPVTGEEQRVPTDELFVVCNGGELYAYKRNAISKYGGDLQQKWRYTHAKRNYTGGAVAPWVVGGLVIGNIGADDDSVPRRNGEIVALAKDDGRLVWSQVVAEEVDNCLVVGDKVYVAHGHEMMVLEAATGKRLLVADSGLQCDKNSTLWTDGHYLYFFSPEDARFRLFTLDGKTLVQDVHIPEDFRLDRMDSATRWPAEHAGRVYFPVFSRGMELNTVVYGLLEMTPGEGGLHPAVEIEQGPPVAVEKCKEGKAEYYELIISHARLDDVLRFGELAVKRVAALHGWQVWNSPARNRKFNGRIVLKVDGAQLDRVAAAPKLDVMAKRVHSWAKTMTVRAGTRKDPIEVRWEWL